MLFEDGKDQHTQPLQRMMMMMMMMMTMPFVCVCVSVCRAHTLLNGRTDFYDIWI
jgi:hypothetical protein